MSYYGDVCDSADKQLDYDVEDPFKMDPLKDISFKVKSAPTKKTNMANGADMVKGKAPGTWDMKHKTEIGHQCCDNFKATVTSSNKDFAAKVNWGPADLNKDGMDSSLEVEAKCIPAKEDWEANAEFKIGGFELGPIKPWSEVSIFLYTSFIQIILCRLNSKQTRPRNTNCLLPKTTSMMVTSIAPGNVLLISIQKNCLMPLVFLHGTTPAMAIGTSEATASTDL